MFLQGDEKKKTKSYTYTYVIYLNLTYVGLYVFCIINLFAMHNRYVIYTFIFPNVWYIVTVVFVTKEGWHLEYRLLPFFV